MRLKQLLTYSLIIFGTWALHAQTPGGVDTTNLIFWYQANSGTSTTMNGSSVTTWDNHTSPNIVVTESGSGLGPLYVTSLANFNPALDFGSVSGGLEMEDEARVNTGASPYDRKSWSVALRTGNDVTTKQLIWEQGGGGTGTNMYIHNGRLLTNLWTGSTEDTTGTAISANTDYIITYVWDGLTNQTADLTVNGVAGNGATSTLSSINNHGGEPGIGLVHGNTQFQGDVGSSGGEPLDGYFMEMIYYDDEVLTANQQQRLESYLAAKYGVTINQNYIAGDNSTIMWNASDNGGAYNNAIAVIGNDSIDSDLNQKQSKSVSSASLVTMGLNTIALDNASNTNSFSGANDFMAWGHDGDGIVFTQMGAPTNRQILERVWNVQETGTVGDVLVQIPAFTSSETTKMVAAVDTVFLVTKNGGSDFSTGTVTSTPMTLVGTNWEATVNFSDDDFFTFAIDDGAILTVTQNGAEAGGPVNIIYTVTLATTNNTGSTITFDIDDLGGGTATSGADYTAIVASDVISVLDGAQTGTYPVTVLDDVIEEATETVQLTISNPSSGTVSISVASADGTITDDDSPTPGGVGSTGLVFWLKADDGPTPTVNGGNIGSWNDESGNGNAFSQSASPTPVYNLVGTNFQPSLDFSNSGGLTIADNAGINTPGPFDDKSYILAFRTGSDVSTRQMLFESGGGGSGLNLFIRGDSLQANLYGGDDRVQAEPLVANTNYIVTFTFDGSENDMAIHNNGDGGIFNLNTGRSDVPNATGDVGLGVIDANTQYPAPTGDVGSGDNFLGDMMEIAYFNERVLSAVEIDRLETYLAIKYGVTLDNSGGGTAGDYVSSDGDSTYWDASANSTYHNHVAGIALDGESGLNQKQSKSSVSDALVTMGFGSIASDNASNSNNIGVNLSAILWGSNNGTVSFTSTGAPGTATILARQWKVEETGTIGTVKVQVPASTSTETTKIPIVPNTVLYLIVDADGNFGSAASVFPMTLNGTNWEVDYDFSDGDFFTFADNLITPGGINTLPAVWLRADEGVTGTTNISAWENQSGSLDYSQGTAASQPSLTTNATNFNPAVNFDGSDILTSNNVTYNDAIAFLVTDNITNDGQTAVHLLDTAGGGAGFSLRYEQFNNTEMIGYTAYGIEDYTSAFSTPYGLLSLISFEKAAASTNYEISELHDGIRSSASLAVDATNRPLPTTDLGEFLNGDVNEVIVFSNTLSSTNVALVESYLAIKYGFTKEGDDDVGTASIDERDYFNSDGTVLWDYSANTTYHNEVVGLIRDDLSGLNQKQSVSGHTDGLITMGLVTIAADNASNVNTFSADNSSLIWGNDNGTLAGQTTNAGLTAQSGDVDQLQRTWKIEETGTVGTVQVAMVQSTLEGYLPFAASYGGLALKIADDASLTTNVTYVDLSVTTINSVAHYAATHDFDGTKFFTIIQRGFILWTGTEWRGGLSTTTNHFPSDEAGDASKTLYVRSSDTANINEAVVVTNITIESSASLKVEPTNCLRVSGTFTNNGDFSLRADNNGYAQYKGVAVAGRFQQYVRFAGWHHIASPFSNATWGDLIFARGTGFINHPIDGASLTECVYCNLWYYDPSTDNGSDIGFGLSDAFGTWRSSTSSSETFDVTKGWNLYLDSISGFGTSPWTLELSGTFNNGNVTQSVNENNAGWNLVSNPYPTVIDWNVIDDDLAAANIALGYHIWDHINSNFATYSASGGGTRGANQYVAPFQSFYVQTATAGAQGSGDVLHNFDLTNADRPDACNTGKFFKTSALDRIVVQTTHLGSGKIDQTIIAFKENAKPGFSVTEDVRKLFSGASGITSVYGKFGSNQTVVGVVPYPGLRDSVKIGVRASDGQQVSIELAEHPSGWTIYLEDLQTGIFYDMENPHTFYQDAGYPDRFVLHFGDDAQKIPFQPSLFSAHVNREEYLEMNLARRVQGAQWTLTNLSGLVVRKGIILEDGGSQHLIDISNLRAGIYILAVYTDGEKHTQKIPLIR